METNPDDLWKDKKNKMTDQEKLVRLRCAKSLYNISKDLQLIESMASDVCLIMAKNIMSDLDLPKNSGSMHTEQTIHDSDVSEEVETMAEKIKSELQNLSEGKISDPELAETALGS